MDLETLKEEAYQRIRHLLPRDTFLSFEKPRTRLLIAMTGHRKGIVDTAYRVFESIAAEGPQEDENDQFAFVRSLAELAEMDAEKGNFELAEERMERALHYYPPHMTYMMSKIHLEIYLTYYRFQVGKKELAFQEIDQIIHRKKSDFAKEKWVDALETESPALGYAIEQKSLFYAMDGNWKQAYLTYEEMEHYTDQINQVKWTEAKELFDGEKYQDAYNLLTEAISYRQS
ncbi:hypothetical protein [Risungbinella massiliensis]|uniref:hypothetical protein n=1 Tax=Risungbinella massiliensis TaxID=1329796 RepID=UPI0005CBE5CE|nr:hypothetical protein [Risungbinella massiliensis]